MKNDVPAMEKLFMRYVNPQVQSVFFPQKIKPPKNHSDRWKNMVLDSGALKKEAKVPKWFGLLLKTKNGEKEAFERTVRLVREKPSRENLVAALAMLNALGKTPAGRELILKELKPSLLGEIAPKKNK